MSCFNIYAFADEAGDKLPEQISAVKENGFKGIEVRGVGGKCIIDYSVSELREIKKELDFAGVSVWSIGSPIGKINISDEFSRHLEDFKKTLEAAFLLGAENIRLFSFFTNGAPELCKNEVTERLGAFVETAKGCPAALCHENEKDIFGDTAERCLYIHKTFPELHAIFDPANFIQCGVDTALAWEMLKKYVKYIHVKDALENGVVVPAGEGVGNLKPILREFAQAGGRDLTLEPHLFDFIGLDKLERSKALHQKTYDDPRAAFDGAAAALLKILAQIQEEM